MKEIIIRKNEAGQRFDKYLKKYLREAPQSFIYKMLRKKNIVLNGKKASGNEKIMQGDVVKLFFSQDTLTKFTAPSDHEGIPERNLEEKLDIIYEDAHILVLNKPSGILSQKAEKNDVSMVEYVISYLLASKQLTKEELRTFRPSICNRLDRNTSGIIVAGKSLAGLQVMNRHFKSRELEKYYLCIVRGRITDSEYIKGYLKKEHSSNKVTVLKNTDDETYSSIETEYIPAAWNEDMSLLKVHLITGRTHQIRAHLTSLGHPLLGDYKYGDKSFNDYYKKRYQIKSQALHAYELRLPDSMEEPLAQLSGRVFKAPLPAKLAGLIKETSWEHGIQEDLEVLHWRI